MINKTILLLARRFLWSTHEKNISAMAIISFISIMIGSCALALVVAVMNGFEHETQKAVQGINPDIIVSAGGKALDYEKIRTAIISASDAVAATAPLASGPALIRGSDPAGSTALAIVMGIDPASQQEVTRMREMITPHSSDLPTFFTGESIIIGHKLGSAIGAAINDPITLLFASESETSGNQLTFDEHPVTIAGTIKTGIDDIDAHAIIMNRQLFDSLFDTGVTTVQVKLTKQAQAPTIIRQLKSALKLDVFSWKELYPALIAALSLEKYAMFFILALITLVASMNIVALLFMYITNKKTEIAVLRTLGLTLKQIRRLFMLIGIGLSTIASIAGIILASIISYLLNTYQLIKLPEVYYVSHLPAHMDLGIGLSVLMLVFVISVLASWWPTRRILTLDIASIFKASA